jgi:hypothetical protein
MSVLLTVFISSPEISQYLNSCFWFGPDGGIEIFVSSTTYRIRYLQPEEVQKNIEEKAPSGQAIAVFNKPDLSSGLIFIAVYLLQSGHHHYTGLRGYGSQNKPGKFPGNSRSSGRPTLPGDHSRLAGGCTRYPIERQEITVIKVQGFGKDARYRS